MTPKAPIKEPATRLEPTHFQFTSGDGLAIACAKWSGQHEVRGVVQIAHGLGEHIGRYAALAEILVRGHFVVYGNDHRGHGLTAKGSGSFGDFGPGGFDQLVEDMVSLRVIAKEEHPGRGSRTFCWGTAWVLSPPSNLFWNTVTRLMAWRFRVLASWMAWHVWRNWFLQERIQ